MFSMHPRGLVVGSIVCALAGCPGRPNGAMPVPPDVVPMPPVSPGWWTSGDAACPALDTGAPVPGGAPGATVHAGRVAGAPEHGIVQCMAAGVPHGPSTRFHAGGQPAESGLLDRGRQSGPWTTWHPNGTVASHGVYRGGEMDGAWSTWFPSGNPRDRGEYHELRRRGVWLTWKDEGFRGAEPDAWVEYDKKGRGRKHGRFRNGEPTESLPICLIGMAYPACRSLPLIDITLGATVGQAAGEDPGKRAIGGIQFGGIFNINEEHGVGASFGWIFDAGYPAMVYDVRYRYWLGEFLALEGALGVISPHSDHPGDGAGMRLQSGFVVGDVITLVTGVERHPTGGGTDDYFAYAGVRVGAPTILTALYVAAEVAGSIK
jgi:hypothetical protein